MGWPKGKKRDTRVGRLPGSPNKATLAAREAIALFVDANSPRLQGWLDDIAEGKQDDNGKWIVQPNPVKAFELFQTVVEYHVPKLSRVESTNKLEAGQSLIDALKSLNGTS